MRASKPAPPPGAVIELSSEDLELSSDHLEEVDENRASIIAAAASAQNIAMLTGTHGVVSPPLLRPRARLPRPEEIHPGASGDSENEGIGRLRAAVAARSAVGDAVGELRARLELARAELALGRLDAARDEARAAAVASENAPAAQAMIRALYLGRTSIDEQLAAVTKLAADAVNDRTRADWLCECARLMEARNGVSDESLAIWRDALAFAPDHAGALYGTEVALDRLGRHAEHAELLGRLASLLDDKETSAWLHVERALLLERRVADVTGATAAFERALELAPGIGPVRAAFVDHLVRHRSDARLASLLEAEAMLEADGPRATRLELDAALAYLRSSADRSRVIDVLERAFGRAPTSRLVDRRVADELARLHDAEGRHTDALRVRKATLRLVEDPREELVVLRALATSAIRANETDDAVLALERARVLEPEDPSLLDDLDRLLAEGKRHEARAILWMRHAAHVEEADKKAEALLVSAEAARAAGRDHEAARQREAAWLTAPSAPGVYDALARTIAPVAPTHEVEERIRLYQQAVVAAKEPDRKIHLLEKLAWLRDDVAGDAAGAAHVYEEILALEPGRLSALVGLASVAIRTGNDRALARALAAQADVTVDVDVRARLRLQAAEALAKVDPERALTTAEQLATQPDNPVKRTAAALVTRIHATAERWERVAESLARRAGEAEDRAHKLPLVLAQVDVLLHRLHAPALALSAIERAGTELADDAALRAATLEALEALGDETRLRSALAQLAAHAASPDARARLLIRAAELDELAGRDADAVSAYHEALVVAPLEALAAERLERLGARAPLGNAARGLVTPLTAAVRVLDAGDGSADALLALGSRSIAVVRTAERLARRAAAAPQVANALAFALEARPSGLLARRALEGLATLSAWTLPESGDVEPWERLLDLGSTDPAALDALVARSRERVRANDATAMRVSTQALLRRVELAADATERLLLHLDLANLLRRAGQPSEAAAQCRLALAADASSVTAACLLAEIAEETADPEAAIAACTALAGIVASDRARAQLFRDAGDLCSVRSDNDRASELFEQALHADPDNVEVAARLSDLQRRRGAFADLARVLRETLTRARTKDAIVPIASELAEVAKANLGDPMLALSALERVREVAPAHVPALFTLSELFIGQRAWDKALGALAETILATNEPAEKLVAYVGRASIYGRVMNEHALACAELRAALEIDPHDARALRGILNLPLGADIGVSAEERAALLGRLVVAESGPAERRRALIELAEARRATGDTAGAEGALVEAASLSPDRAMLERVRAAVGDDAATLGRILARAVARAHEVERPIDPTWLVTLGRIEHDLGRVDDAIERFEEALRGDGTRDDARIGLVRALGARNRHDHAVAELTHLVAGRSPMNLELVRLLDNALVGAGRASEQWVARELRALAADLTAAELGELEGRYRNPGWIEGLSAASLRRAVMPNGYGRHPIWDVSEGCIGLAGKVARVGLADLGSSTRERVKPRTTHPLRPVFDRALRTFELTEVELAVSEHVTAPAVACEDEPWVVVPASLANASEAYVLAALARPLTRIALGVPWLGALAAGEVLAVLVSLARQVAPGFAATPLERIEPLVAEIDPRVRRALDRKRRRVLDDLEPVLSQAPMVDEVGFAEVVLATEARAAFLLSGSLRASLDALAPTDGALLEALRFTGPGALAAVFAHAPSRHLVSFAIQAETATLRRTLGGR